MRGICNTLHPFFRDLRTPPDTLQRARNPWRSQRRVPGASVSDATSRTSSAYWDPYPPPILRSRDPGHYPSNIKLRCNFSRPSKGRGAVLSEDADASASKPRCMRCRTKAESLSLNWIVQDSSHCRASVPAKSVRGPPRSRSERAFHAREPVAPWRDAAQSNPSAHRRSRLRSCAKRAELSIITPMKSDAMTTRGPKMPGLSEGTSSWICDGSAVQTSQGENPMTSITGNQPAALIMNG